MSIILANSLDAPDQPTMYILLAAAATFVIWAIMRPRNKKTRDPLEQSPKFSLAQQKAVERQMSNLLVELSEMARQITAQLDTRSTKLELLIKDADERMAALRSLLEAQSASESQPREKWAITADAPAALATSATAGSSKPVEAALMATAPGTDPRHLAVYLLADQGRSAAEIARQLGRPSGEIELILALRS